MTTPTSTAFSCKKVANRAGLVITFSQEARFVGDHYGVEMVDGARLLAMLHARQPSLLRCVPDYQRTRLSRPRLFRQRTLDARFALKALR